jgi:hypothetical protein
VLVGQEGKGLSENFVIKFYNLHIRYNINNWLARIILLQTTGEITCDKINHMLIVKYLNKILNYL